MSKAIKKLKYFFLFSLIVALTACASSRQNPYMRKRQKTSKVSTSQLGRNKYYFSTKYQKKLVRNYKKRSR
jgi:hypothetical protein